LLNQLARKGLSESLEGIYNTDVNSAKIKHALLIAVLLYGQFVSNTHVIGHLHAHEDKSNHSVAQIDCGAAFHGAGTATPLVSQHQNHAHAQSEISDKDAKKDCSIYHVLLSLNGTFWINQNEFGISRWREGNQSYAPGIITNVASDNHRIRAPPVIS